MSEGYKEGVNVGIKKPILMGIVSEILKGKPGKYYSREQSSLLQMAQHENGSSWLKSKRVSIRKKGRLDFEEEWLSSVINIALTVRAMCDDKPPKLFITLNPHEVQYEHWNLAESFLFEKDMRHFCDGLLHPGH